MKINERFCPIDCKRPSLSSNMIWWRYKLARQKNWFEVTSISLLKKRKDSLTVFRDESHLSARQTRSKDLCRKRSFPANNGRVRLFFTVFLSVVYDTLRSVTPVKILSSMIYRYLKTSEGNTHQLSEGRISLDSVSLQLLHHFLSCFGDTDLCQDILSKVVLLSIGHVIPENLLRSRWSRWIEW